MGAAPEICDRSSLDRDNLIEGTEMGQCQGTVSGKVGTGLVGTSCFISDCKTLSV